MTDVVVVGLGPAGIVAAHVLARSGLRVTAIHPHAPAGTRSPIAAPAPTLRADPALEAVRQSGPPAGTDAVGGAKLLAAPQSYRLNDWTFRARTETLRRYGELPDGADLVDWPIAPDNLAPWYARVERAMGVTARPATTWTELMTDAAAARGWRPFAAPAAGSTDASPLLGGDVEIIDATATAVRRTSTGDVHDVECADADGATRTVACRAVVIAASVLPTVRLLLLSDLTAAGRVGRWFMAHNAFVVHGHFPGADLGRRHAGAATAVAVGEFEDDRFDHRGLGFLGGSVLQAAMTGRWSDARMSAATAGLDARTTGNMNAQAWVGAHHPAIGSVWAQPDQLPRATNTIDLDPVHRDPLGLPVARVTFSLADDDRRRWQFLSARAAEWLQEAGAHTTWRPPLEPQPLGTHLYGGARMGDDPATSVVDGYGRFHGAPGVIVVGSSTFPSTGGRGPVQTIEALAWRSAAQLVEDLR